MRNNTLGWEMGSGSTVKCCGPSSVVVLREGTHSLGASVGVESGVPGDHLEGKGQPQLLAWMTWRMVVVLSGVETLKCGFVGDHEFIWRRAGFEEPMEKSPHPLESILQEKFLAKRSTLKVISKSVFGSHLPCGGRELTKRRGRSHRSPVEHQCIKASYGWGDKQWETKEAESSQESQKKGEESDSGRRGCLAQIKCGQDWEVP